MSSIATEKLQALAKDFGTPLYVYDADKITAQYKRPIKLLHNTNALPMHLPEAM